MAIHSSFIRIIADYGSYSTALVKRADRLAYIFCWWRKPEGLFRERVCDAAVADCEWIGLGLLQIVLMQGNRA